MKAFLSTVLLLTTTAAFAQTTEQIKALSPKGTGGSRVQMSMTGGESNKIFAGRTIIPGIYNEQGKLMDSLEAMRLKRTYEYAIYPVLVEGKTYRRTLTKLNLPALAKQDEESKKFFAPKNPALQEGATLDLKPFGNRIPAEKVAGKGIVLIFWYPGFTGLSDGFAENNDVISNYIGKGNFEVYAVTRYPYGQATTALKTTPIANAHHLFESGDLVDIYAPNNQLLLVVTDKDHKITYSVTANTPMTPRILNGLLKAL